MKKLVLAIAMAVAISGNAMAADGDFYIGIGYGNTKLKDLGSESSNDGVVSKELDVTDSGAKLFAGYELNKNLSIEAFYADLGKAQARINATGEFSDEVVPGYLLSGSAAATANATLSAKSFGVAGIFKLPVTEQFSVFAKIGFHNWDSKLSFNGENSGTVRLNGRLLASAPGFYSASFSDSGTDTMYGIGAVYNIDNKFSIRAEYEVSAFGGDLIDTDVEFISVGAQMKF